MATILRKVGRKAALPLLFLLVFQLPAAAKEGDPMAEGAERFLDGHGFLPSIYVSDPFVSSVFQNHTGGGVANDLTATFTNQDGDELFSVTGDIFFASLGLGYQQKLGSRFALGCYVSGLVRSGTSAQSFLTEGADVNQEVALWAKYRLRRTEKSQLSVGIDWSYANTFYFTPGDFANYIVEGGAIEDAPLVTNSKVWASHMVFNWVRAFSPVFGLRLNGEIGLYQVPDNSDIYKGTYRLGILGEMDLNKTKLEFPLGLTLGYTQALPDDDPYTGQSGTLLGFWYTGKKAFVVGLETGFMKVVQVNQTTETVNSNFGIFTIKYYF